MSKKQSADARFSKSKLALAIAVHILAAGNAFAAPMGGEVVGGSGSIEPKGSDVVVIQNTDRLAIDWQSFDIGKDERVQFIQPEQSAVALNRILGNKGSEILGRIDANGHVILVNPRGVVFGENATVNVGGLIASGLQINPEDFMNGDLVFKRIEGTDGTVINSGMINAAAGGNVVLLGETVENRGLISAKLGSVVLASGKEAVLTFDESGLLGVRVDEAILQDELGGTAAVANSGEIRAESGRILLSASTTRDVFSQAVNWEDQKQARSVTYNEDGSFVLSAGGNVQNSGSLNVSGEDNSGIVVAVADNVTHTGSIHADAVNGKGGAIELHSNRTTLVADQGVVTTNGTQGGDIKLLGKNVGLFDQAIVEAKGLNGGGAILVGGDQEGLNSEIRNADFVYLEAESKIDASATEAGDGGKAIIFAEDTARIYGYLSARGGKSGGSGGFVETSGKSGFEIGESPDVSATNGAGGHWLIDPYSIVIENGSNGGYETQSGNRFVAFTSNGNSTRLNVNTLENALNNNGDNFTVTVKTGEGGPQAGGNITVSNEINLTSSVTSTLNLIAHNNITVNANITTVVGNNKSANRKLNLHLNANVTGGTNQGGVSFGNNVRIETGGGDFVVGAIGENGVINPDASGAHNVDFSNATIDVSGAPYNENQLRDYYRNPSPGLLTESQREFLASSGRIAINASNDVTLGRMVIKGREAENGAAKVGVRAGRDILLNQDLLFDNNPTEVLQAGQIANDGYTTLQLIAGNDIRLNGRIRREFPNTPDNWGDHQDRLHIHLTADSDGSGAGDVVVRNDGEVEIETRGGDFIIHNSVNVDLAGRTVDTRSLFGAGDVSITASGDITLGELPMFVENSAAGSLRDPSLTLSAGDRLDIGENNLYTRNGDIQLGATAWEFDGNSLTTRGGNITLTTAGDLELPELNSSGNITLASRDADDSLSVTSGSGALRLNGLLSLDLKAGSAEITNITNNATGNTADIALTSGQDIDLQTTQAIRLGNSTVSGDLTLTSGAGITQQVGSSVTVAGISNFSVNEASVILSQAENIFGGAVWVGGTGAQNAELVSAQNLILGRADQTMQLAGTLSASAVGDSTEPGDITQVGALAVAQGTTLSAGGTINLANDANQFSSLGIVAADAAVIHNGRDLALAAIENVDTLDLSVAGDLTQNSALSVETLILAITGNTGLANPGNSIANLSGILTSGEVVAVGALALGNLDVASGDGFKLTLTGENSRLTQTAGSRLRVAADTTISARTTEVSEEIQLQDEGSLTFADVMNFVLRGRLLGEDSAVNRVAVNGSDGDGNYAIDASAEWQDVTLAISGGVGTDTLVGPNLDATWRIGAAEPHGLVTSQGEIAFRTMEILAGGNGDDTFEFADAATTTLSLRGGEGADVADYASIEADINVPLGQGGGISGVERIRGNNDGTGTFNSALVAQGDTDNTWVVNAINTGRVTPAGGTAMTFEGFNQLRGGGGADQFDLQADLRGAAAAVDGGAGADTFRLAAPLSARIRGGADDDEFLLMTDLPLTSQLDGGAGLNTLQGSDADQLWVVGQLQDGSAYVTLAPAPELAEGEEGEVPAELQPLITQALGITGMLGGAGDDTFQYLVANSGVGADGGGGANTADFSAVAGDLNVKLGALDLLGVSRVGQLIGNSAAVPTGEGGFTSALTAVGTGATQWTLGEEDAGTVRLADGTQMAFRHFSRLVGGDGTDSFTLGFAPADGVAGGAGDDTFVLTAPDLDLRLVGGAGRDTLRAYQGAANTWTLDDPVSLLRTGTGAEPDANTVYFETMEVLDGAADFSDTFAFQSLTDPQPVIRAGNGAAEDAVDYSALDVPVPVILGSAGLTGFERVVGNGALSSLQGADSASTWTLTAEQGGRVQWTQNGVALSTAFSGFGQWIGGSQNDRFVLQSAAGAPASIRGGGGTDELDLSAVTAPMSIASGPGATGNLLIDGLEKVTANPGYANSLISGADQNSWTLSGLNAGQLVADGATPLSFTGISHLRGLHNDLFKLEAAGALAMGNTLGSLTGGDGRSVLQAADGQAHTWTVSGNGLGALQQAGGAKPLLTFSGLKELLGGTGADDFTLNAATASAVVIDGGGGANRLAFTATSTSPLEWNLGADNGSLDGHIEVFRRIQTLVGHGGADTVSIAGATWLTEFDTGAGNDSILLLNGARVARIRAGSGDDTIALEDTAQVTEGVQGGAGTDHLNLARYGSALEFNPAAGRFGNVAYTEVERFSAPANRDNSLRGPDADNDWTISKPNEGRLTSASGLQLDFTGISSLLGGAAKDAFHLSGGSLSGAIDGGAGDNSLSGGVAGGEWNITGNNRGTLVVGDLNMAFTNIGQITGGAGADAFLVAPQGRLTGWLSGGAGTDRLTFNAGAEPAQVWVGATSAAGPAAGGGWWRVRSDIESLAARPHADNRLQLESSAASQWQITEVDSGLMGTVAFSGFGRLTGGAGNDKFTFSGRGRLSGLLDGGAGENAVDLLGLTNAVTVAQGERSGAFLQLDNIHKLDASPGKGNELWGADVANLWTLDTENTGVLNGQLTFSGFDRLVGGSADDQFRFQTSDRVTVQLDGGAHVEGDSADYSSLTGPLNLDLRDRPLVYNVERLVGNEQTALIGPDQNTTWYLTGPGAGRVTYGLSADTQLLNFTGVSSLSGGNAVDEFRLEGGSMSGGVLGGGGRDRFYYTLTNGTDLRTTRLDGGGDEDTLELLGGSEGWRGTSGTNAGGLAQFSFTAPGSETAGAPLNYSGMEDVLLRATLDEMRVESPSGAVTLGESFWKSGDLTAVNYRDSLAALHLKAGVESEIHLAGDIYLPRQLILEGGAVVVDSPSSLQTQRLELRDLQQLGSAGAALPIQVDHLAISGKESVLHLREADGVTLDSLSSSGLLDLQVVNGDLTQGGGLSTAAESRLAAVTGGIFLDHEDNQLGGSLGLSGNRVVLRNNQATQLGNVVAQEFNLVSAGAVTAEGVLSIGDTARLTGAGLDLTNPDNHLELVFLESTGDVNLVDKGHMTIMDSQVAGKLDVRALALSFDGDLVADNLVADAGLSGLSVTRQLSLEGDALFNSQGPLVMYSGSRVLSESGAIALSSAGVLGLGELIAENGNVRLETGSYIYDGNDQNNPALNVKTESLWMRSATGIGADNPLELAVQNLDAVNREGEVLLANSGHLTIGRLRSGGNISLRNNTDVTLLAESVNAFYGTEEPQYPENKEQPDITHSFSLTLESGSISTDGTVVPTQPHIAAYTVTITNPHGIFLPPSPVIYAPKELTITIGRSRNRPHWGFNVQPDDINDDTTYYGDVVGAGEQLIEVESLADIDPAIFTQVRNFIYRDISIRLPSDQLYEEE